MIVNVITIASGVFLGLLLVAAVLAPIMLEARADGAELNMGGVEQQPARGAHNAEPPGAGGASLPPAIRRRARLPLPRPTERGIDVTA